MISAFYPVIGKQMCYPFYLSGVGICDPELNIVREAGLASHQILFTLEGEGEIVIDGNTYAAKPGSVFYVASKIPHKYYPVGEKWTTCWVVFRGEHVQILMKGLGFSDYNFGMVDLEHNLKKIFDAIFLAAKDSMQDDEKCALLLYNYIIAVRRELFFGNQGDGDHIVNKAIAFINENYAADITLNQLAQLCQCSPQHVCRLFKKKTGLRPLQYLARKRINEAKVLLCNSKESIAEIGRKTGYPDPTYFGMVFKKHEGVSPSDFRRVYNAF